MSPIHISDIYMGKIVISIVVVLASDESNTSVSFEYIIIACVKSISIYK